MAATKLFSSPPRTPLVAASILSADFARMGEEAAAAVAAGADLLHLDVMDGHFVPNLTMGPDMCRGLRAALPEVFMDVHLMVSDPAAFVRAFAEAGADHLTFHVEAVDDVASLAATIRDQGMSAGVALNPATGVSDVKHALGDVDLVLVMSVVPGFAGQTFMPEVLDKARVIGPTLRRDQRLQIDGGINAQTAAAARGAGCDCLVAASAIFGTSDYARAVDDLRGAEQGETSWPRRASRSS